MAVADAPAAQLLRAYRARHSRPARLGCSGVAHRDLGFCSHCFDSSRDDPGFGTRMELSGWRLLAMAERGFA